MKEKATKFIKTLTIPLLLCVSIVAAMAVSETAARNQAYLRAQADLFGMAEEQAAATNAVLNGQFDVLEAVSASLVAQGAKDATSIVGALPAVAANTGFTGVGVVMPDGELYTDKGNTSNVADRAYFHKAIAGERALAYLPDNRFEGETRTVLAVPLRDEERIEGVLIGTYDPMTLYNVLFSQRDGVTAFMTDGDGGVIAGVPNDGDVSSAVSLFETFANAAWKDGKDLHSVQAAMAAGQSGAVEYQSGGVWYYAAFMPAGGEIGTLADWFVWNIAPSAAIWRQAREMTQGHNISSILIMLLTVGAFLYTTYREIGVQRKLRAEAETMRVLKEEYQIAALHSNKFVFRYDVASRTAVNEDKIMEIFHVPHIVSNMPEAYIELGAIPPDAVDAYMALFDAVHAGIPSGSAELRLYLPDEDDYRWSHWDYTTIFNAHSKPERCIFSAYDMTEQKLEQERYANAQAQAQAISANRAAFNITRNVMTDTAGTGLMEMWGLNAQSGLDAMFSYMERRVVAAVDQDVFKRTFDRKKLLQSFAKGDHDVDLELRFIDGSAYRWNRVSLRMAQHPDNGDVMGFLWVTDINDEKKLAKLLDCVVDRHFESVLLIEPDKDKDNVHAVQIDHRKSDRRMDYVFVLQHNLHEYVLAEDQARVVREMDLNTIREGLENRDHYDVFFRTKSLGDGIRNRRITCYYLDADKKDIVMTSADVTDAVTEQAKARLAAEQASIAKSEFLSHMSHDMRTPMNAIIGFSDLGEETSSLAESQSYHKKVGESGRYLLQLINDTLDMAKIESRKVAITLEPLCWGGLKEMLDTIIAPSMREKGIRFTAEAHGVAADAYFMIDRQHMDRVILNLLNNALKFTPPGGEVQFLFSADTSSPSFAQLSCTVRDTGCGMDTSFQSHLYEPFEQEDSAKPGTGLGLSIVKNLVNLMGGLITCTSEKGKGTKFLVVWDCPYATEAQIAALHGKEREKTDFLGRRILLAEDHPMNVLVARKILEKSGAQVETAENGKIALDMFTASAPDYYAAILMDIRMPVMNGLEAAAAIRALEREDAKRIPIIAMTANAFEEDIQRSREAGMNAHLSKPIEREKLSDTLKNLLKTKAGPQ
ncbi:MAG: response regulator [Eubacteriales bacterium]|nr:response regulator [Eubacteriales bacterium]